jgi:hypothetical protein
LFVCLLLLPHNELISILKTNLLMLFRELGPLCFSSQTMLVNTAGQSTQFFNITGGGTYSYHSAVNSPNSSFSIRHIHTVMEHCSLVRVYQCVREIPNLNSLSICVNPRAEIYLCKVIENQISVLHIKVTDLQAKKYDPRTIGYAC